MRKNFTNINREYRNEMVIIEEENTKTPTERKISKKKQEHEYKNIAEGPKITTRHRVIKIVEFPSLIQTRLNLIESSSSGRKEKNETGEQRSE